MKQKGRVKNGFTIKSDNEITKAHIDVKMIQLLSVEATWTKIRRSLKFSMSCMFSGNSHQGSKDSRR